MKGKHMLFAVMICLLLTGCSILPSPPDPFLIPSIPIETASAPTDAIPVATIPATVATTSPVETKPEHSPLYIPGLSVEDVILYFNEVCLDAEFSTGGDPSCLQRWEEPIRYIVFGNPTEEDLRVMAEFTLWLNTIEGFPGIWETKDAAQANMRIHFCSEAELISLLGDNFYGTDGGVTFWYRNNEIYDAIICYRTDLYQQLRNSVILEEIYNGLGPVQDTDLRTDSIIYSGFSEPQELTQIDELLLRLLYHPQMMCGMNAASCETVIRQLYY